MELQILKCGSAVVAHKGQVWLLDAPRGVGAELDALGIVPDILLRSRVAAPGVKELPESLKSVCQIPLRGDGLDAEAIKDAHGWDYVITDDAGASFLYTQRGDVSAKAVSEHDLALIGNKYRANAFDESVITRPWPAVSLFVAPKVWKSMEEVPDNLKTLNDVPLTLAQANAIARQAEAVEGAEEPWGVAIASFKQRHHIEDGRWVENKTDKADVSAMGQRRLVCPNCGSRNREGASNRCANCGETMIEDRRRGAVTHAVGRLTVGALAGAIKTGQMDDDETEDDEEPEEEETGKAERDGKFYQTRGGKLFPASDFLVVRDPKEPSSWSLPVTKEPGGPPDRGMMGAAAAALTSPGGHRGKKFGGTPEEKRSAIRKLIALYRRLEVPKEDWPPGLQRSEKRYSDLEAGITILKTRYPELAQADEGLTIYQTKSNQWRWASITSAVMWDKQNELVTRKAMDFAIALATITGNRGTLRHEHIPGLDSGVCDWQMRKGDLLFESGYFLDTPFAQRCREKYTSDPGYRISAGLHYKADDLVDGVYHRMAIFERSATKSPAVPITILGVKDMFEVSDEMLKQVSDELSWPLEDVKQLVERAMKSDTPPDSLESLKTALVTGKTEAAVDELLGKLDESAKAVLLQKLSPAPDPAPAPETPPAPTGGSTDEIAALKATVDALTAQITESQKATTEAMTVLAEALKGGGSQPDINTAVANFLSQLPRQEAAEFLTQKTGGGAGGATLEALQQTLNEMAQKVDKLSLGGMSVQAYGELHDRFTSRRLNPNLGAGGVQ